MPGGLASFGLRCDGPGVGAARNSRRLSSYRYYKVGLPVVIPMFIGTNVDML